MLTQRRISRRQVLGGAAGTALAAFAAACGGGDKEEKAATPGKGATGEPKRGGTIHTTTGAPILNLDPHDTTGSVWAPYFYSFVAFATDWEGNVGDLAESWEVPDNINWTFKLRGDARFPDMAPTNGRPVVAQDVVNSIQRILSSTGVTQLWTPWVDAMGAPDDRTFTFRTTKPWGDIFWTMGAPSAGIVPIEAAGAVGDLKQKVIGSGPFMLGEYSRDEKLDYLRNPTYYHDYPYVDGSNVKVIADDTARQAAFRAGSIDVYVAPNKIQAEAMRSMSGVTYQRFLNRPYTTLVINADKVPAFKDERVREAIDLSLDRKRIIDKLYFGDAELCGPVGPVWQQTALPAEEVEAAYKLDIGKAKQLLSAAGAEGLHFTISFPTTGDASGAPADLAAILKENLAQAGIVVDLKAMEFATWFSTTIMTAGFEANAFGHWQYLSDVIPLQNHHSKGYNRAGGMYLGIDDPQVDALLDKIEETPDPDEHKQLAWEAQRLILQRHGPHFSLCQPYGHWLAYDYIKGYKATAYGFGMFKFDVWIDKG